MASITVKKPKNSIGKIFLDVLDKTIVPTVKNSTEHYANECRQWLIDKIRSSDFDFAPLNAEYAAQKEKEGKDTILINTEDYINSIKVFKTKTGFTIGVDDAVHFGDKAAPVPMVDLANWLEYGIPEKNLPARPHWRPLLLKIRREQQDRTKKTKETMVKETRAELMKQVKNAVTRKAGEK